MPRRASYDPFAQTSRPHELTAIDVCRNEVARRAVPAGSDLREAFEGWVREWEADGWVQEQDPYMRPARRRFPSQFMRRGGERIELGMPPTDPSIGSTVDMMAAWSRR